MSIEELTLVHRQGGNDFKDFPNQWLPWETCLRKIILTNAEEKSTGQIEKSDQILNGMEAYSFLLEVVCGLHSPLIGETEVMGQFKIFADQGMRSPGLHKILQSVLTDAKTVREKYLKNLGSRTYGSLIRRYIKDTSLVAILGAGQLAHEILPWIAKRAASAHIFCRSPLKVVNIIFKNVSVCDLKIKQTNEFDTIVIAAPLTDLEIGDWLDKNGNATKLVIDLRGDLRGELTKYVYQREQFQIVKLPEIFKELDFNQEQVQAKVTLAKNLILELGKKRLEKSGDRPFGWEDLCG